MWNSHAVSGALRGARGLMHSFRLTVLMAVCVFASLALVGIPPARAAAPQAYKVTAWVVGTYTSEVGADKGAFVLKVAEALKAWTDKTGTEACGPIVRTASGALQVTLTTEKSQVVCLISTQAPAGVTLTGDSIHSHPTDGGRRKVRLTTRDLAALRALGRSGFVSMLQNLDIRQVDAEPDTFSPDDYATGSGYLVVGSRLLYQHGVGTAALVTALPATDEALASAPSTSDGNHAVR